MLLAPAGLLAGAITTLAGIGGGMLLTLALAAVLGPQAALATAAPALLLGNLHRAALFRAHVDVRVATLFAAGALPGSFVGGLLTAVLPESVLSWLLLGSTALLLLRRFEVLELRPDAKLLVPVAFGTGLLTATAGGAGLLITPVLLSVGLRGERFVATTSVVAVAMHVGRILAYGAGGLVDAQVLASAALIAVGLFAGNLLGRRVRGLLDERSADHLTHGVLAVCTLLAISGVR